MKIVVVVDMQNDFISGSLGSPEAIKVCENMEKYLKTLNVNNTCVIFTQDTHYSNYLESLEGKKLPVPHCAINTKGWKIANNLWENVSCSKEVVFKRTFGSLDLPEILVDCLLEKWACEEDELEEIEIMGVCTDICVVSNALILRANFPNTNISVHADLCAGTSLEAHEAALKVMSSCQIDIKKGEAE